jgi:hypothetical protein
MCVKKGASTWEVIGDGALGPIGRNAYKRPGAAVPASGSPIATLALPDQAFHLRIADGGAYRVHDPDVVRTSRAEELDELVAADLRRLYDRGFSVEEIRESYQRKLPSSFLQRGPH